MADDWTIYKDDEDDPQSNARHPYCPDVHLKTAIQIHARRLLIDQVIDPDSVSNMVARVSAVNLKENWTVFIHSNSWSISSEWMYFSIP